MLNHVPDHVLDHVIIGLVATALHLTISNQQRSHSLLNPYQWRRFSFSIHLTRLRGFLLTSVHQTIILIPQFFLLSFLWVRRFFSSTILLILPHLPYRARRFFVSKKHWFSSPFSCRIWRFFYLVTK